ncbi:hypothetical protein [Synechococcus sp. PCC 7335]|uniref:hypothetical protein n=1 Tax=Synechococcus sp. (strain ATCC 29403 / PCC 7335) TaxID=91464 RepID=UPI0012FA7215|nr:hypothetical protein [Synechococcus sp. PCC 7335]
MSLGSWLQCQMKGRSFPSLHHLPFRPNTYTRNCIAKEALEDCNSCDQRFEALILCWDKQVKTRIHGHPAFSFYHVVSGVFEIDTFSCTSQSKLQLEDTQTFLPADTTWFSGQAGRYDNWIHSVRCLEAGLTFHIYSEDAQKGIVL